MDSMHSTLSMYYDYNAHVKGELLVMMKNSQSVNLLIFISNTLIELFNDFGFDYDGIPERPTMYLNLWSYKVVRHRYSNLMIQPEPEGSTQGYPLVSVEVLRLDPHGFKGYLKIEVKYYKTKNSKKFLSLLITELPFIEVTIKVLKLRISKQMQPPSFSIQQIKKGMGMYVQNHEVTSSKDESYKIAKRIMLG
ncbi:hypothetical protein Tco_0426108 [Tanacetum coccineum]